MPDAPAHAARGQTAARHAPTAAPPDPAKPAPMRVQQPRPNQAGAGGGQAKPGGQLMSELKVSGHLMTLENGLYCVVQTPAKGAEPGSGLPGVRLSLPPGSVSRPDAVSISGYRADGWLSAAGDAALVRVSNGPAQLLVTIYQSLGAGEGTAPNIQVMRLLDGPASGPGAAAPAGGGVGAAGAAAANGPAPAPAVAVRAPVRSGPAIMEMVAHIQERGDVGAMLGDWLGERGSRRWIEGFGLSPTRAITPKDIEYQGVLGQGWLSPWVEGGQFCGSRAMALPLLGLRVRLRGAAAEANDVLYSATFIDGAAVGPVMNGEPCEADSLAAMEAFQVVIRPRAARIAEAPEAAAARSSAARSAAAKPAPAKPARGGKAKAAPAAPEPTPARSAPARSKAAAAKGGKAPAGRKR